MNLEPFKELLRDRSGLEFQGVAEKPLLDAIEQRCNGDQPMMPEAYRHRLLTDEGEFDRLVSLLTINETYFYREPGQIHLFVETLVPRLLSKRPTEGRLRILSAGCSTGEEPYSLAMALLEKFGPQALDRFAIVAGDIDRQALQRACAGQYRDFSFRAMPADLRAKYFHSGGGGTWQIQDQLRRLVVFQHLNLFSTLQDEAAEPFDAIFFRNVSIYFGVEKRRQIHQLFDSLLQPHGVVMIGTAETLANDLGVFSLVEEKGLFYFSKEPTPKEPSRPCPSPTLTPTPAKAPTPPPCEAVNQDQRLLESFQKLQKKDYSQAESLASQVLEDQTWSVDACVILGLIEKSRGNSTAAVQWFKQAVYDKNECWPAHYYLAELYRASLASEKAQREYRTVLHLLGSGGAAAGLQVIPLELPAAEVRFLCEHQLDKLTAVDR